MQKKIAIRIILKNVIHKILKVNLTGTFVEQDFPEDPTGEFETIKVFIKDNIDTCKWVGLAIVIMQVRNFPVVFAMLMIL